MTTLTLPHAPGFVKWSPLSGAYFDPSDLAVISRAQSILFSLVGDAWLTRQEADDVIKWHKPQH